MLTVLPVVWSRAGHVLFTFTAAFTSPQRLGNEGIGKNKPRFHNVIDQQQYIGWPVATKPHAFALAAGEFAAEAFASVYGDIHLYVGNVTGISVEVRAPHQWPINARR